MKENVDYTTLLNNHKSFFRSYKTRSLDFRLKQLDALQKAIIKYEDRIVDALRVDLGRNELETYSTELGFVLNSIRIMKRKLPRYMRKSRVSTPLFLWPSQSYYIYEPYGTVLIIGPFNYPFQLLIEPLVGVIAAGNCAVLKPSEMVPNFSRVISEMIEETFDKDYISIVEGGKDTNTQLLSNKFDYIFFTGSTRVGKIVMVAASKNLTPVTLELGGKSPAIVMKDADIRRAARRIIYGKTLNAGQTCVAPDYVLVEEPVKQQFIDACIETIIEFYTPTPINSDSYSRIANDSHFNRLDDLIKTTNDTLVYGGITEPNTRYIQPTLFESSWDSILMEDELFGPILPIISFSSIEKSIQLINDRPKPLALYIFSNNRDIQQRIINSTSSGGVTINDTIFHLVSGELPFGGVGDSGIGNYHGRFSMETFSHKRAVLKTTFFDVPFIYPPYSKKHLKWIKRFLK